MDAPLDSLRSALADRFAIERQLGRGGMATVYLATDVRHRRQVALKVLDATIASTLGPERFLREIEIAAKLAHPNIVPLHEAGRVNGVLFYVMPFVEGESLRVKLDRERQLSVTDALRFAAEVAEALDYAHRHGVVHRDVKPENIMIAEQHAMVLDFGIARAVYEAGGERLTATGVGVGTPAYMSPEQASGERDIDARSDIFSLGCVLYEMLAGKAPFTAPTIGATMSRIITARAPLAREVRADVPAAVDDVLQRALAKDRKDRLQTAGDTATRLHDAATSVAIDRARLTRKTFRLALPLAAAGGIAIAGALFWNSFRNGSPATGTALQSIAVLPFSTEGTDTANAYFASGISEELLNALADVQGLRVAAQTSSFTVGRTLNDPREIARQLGVATLLEGSVRRSASTVRVTARLVSARDGGVLWRDSFDTTASGVFEVQEQIARAIVEQLRVRLTEGETAAIVRRRTQNPEAHDLVLRARHLTRGNFRPGLLEAARLLQQALTLDSTYAATYAQIARVYQSLAVFRDQSGLPGEAGMSAGEMLRRARLAAQRAVDLDPRSATAHGALGLLLFRYDWDWGAAERELLLAIKLQPTSSEAHQNYHRFLRSMGRFAEARQRLDSATKYGELGSPKGLEYGRVSFFAHDFERAIRETLEDFDPKSRTGTEWLAQAYTGARRYAKADSLLSTLVLSRNPGFGPSLAMVYAHTGRVREARALVSSISGTERDVPTMFAGVYAALGDTAAALAELDRAILTRDPLVVDFKVAPWLDPLRKHTRFIAMMRMLNFPQ